VEPGYRGKTPVGGTIGLLLKLRRGVEPGYRGKRGTKRGVEPGYRGKEENHNHPHLTGLLNIFCHIV
jgi:hypothetical protein